jgi:hypothetical protein
MRVVSCGQVYPRLGSDWESLDEGDPLLLKDAYFRPDYLEVGGIAAVLRGLVTSQEAEIDTHLVDGLR